MELPIECECGKTPDRHHADYCDVNADSVKVDAQLQLDFSGKTFDLSYRDRSTEAVRNKVLAGGNGHREYPHGHDY